MNDVFRNADRDVLHLDVDIDRALLALAHRQHGLVHRRDVSGIRVTPGQWQRRVARGEWVAVVGREVWRHVMAPDTWQIRARAGLMYLGPDAALFGGTSLAWWGLEIDPPKVVEFVVPRGRRRLSNELRIHTTDDWSSIDLTRHDGVRVTSVARAIIDLAGSGCTATVLEKVIDSAIKQRRTSLPTLTRRMSELGGSGRAGIRLLRTLLLDSGGETYLERKFLQLVRRHSLPRPECQVIHKNPQTGRVIRVDFQYTSLMIVVEVTGRVGHTSDRDRQKDARRRNALQRQGWLVLEFTTADVIDDVPYVVETLRDELSKRSCRASSTPDVL
jgi:very-short-patch-repair endonuclease